ncbi:MAG TPA: hypothetical protein VHC18_01825 [Amycolatopsis sp.]|nr:hypothetical protein [Amycolatopsis sp.]
MTETQHPLPHPALVANLTDVRLRSISAEVCDGSGEPDKASMQIGMRSEWDEDDHVLGFSLDYQVDLGADGSTKLSVTASYLVTFVMARPFDGSPDTLAEFGTKVAAMAVHPYLREVVASLAARMGFEVKPLPLLRPSDLTAKEEPAPSEELGPEPKQ